MLAPVFPATVVGALMQDAGRETAGQNKKNNDQFQGFHKH